MNGKIFWFEPDFKMVGDGDRLRVWSAHLSAIKMEEDTISFSYTYDNDRFDVKLKLGNPDFYNGEIVCNGENIGVLATKRFISKSSIILDGSYNVPTDGNYGCLIEIIETNTEK